MHARVQNQGEDILANPIPMEKSELAENISLNNIMIANLTSDVSHTSTRLSHLMMFLNTDKKERGIT